MLAGRLPVGVFMPITSGKGPAPLGVVIVELNVMEAPLCVTTTGRVIVGQAEHDSSDGLVAALLKVGCRDVLELDRGSHHPAFVHRAATATPPVDDYEESGLYLLGRPMIPHAFRWKPEGSVPSTRVTSYDAPHAPPPRKR